MFVFLFYSISSNFFTGITHTALFFTYMQKGSFNTYDTLVKCLTLAEHQHIHKEVKIASISQEFCNTIACTALELYTILEYESDLY